MQIKKLGATNVKGQSFSHELGPCTIFYGDPFSGKTARRDALVFLLLGYLPWLGKLPGATAKLCSAESMAAGIEIEDGTIFKRTLTLKGGIASVSNVDGLPEIPAVLINTTDYLGLGPTDQAKFIFQRVTLDPEKYSTSAVIDQIKKLQLPETSTETVEYLLERVEELKANEPATGLQDWLEYLIDSEKQVVKSNRDASKRYAGSSQSSIEMGVIHGQQTSRSAAEIESDLAKLKPELQSIYQRHAAVTSKITDRDRQEKARASANATIASIVDRSPEIEALENQLKELDTPPRESKSLELSNLVSGLEVDRISIKGQMDTLERSIKSPNTPEITALNNQEIQLTSELKSKQTLLEEMEARFNIEIEKPECPICGTTGDDWKAKAHRHHLKLTKPINVAVREIKQKLLDLKETFKSEMTKHVESLDSQLVSTSKRLQEVSSELDILKSRLRESMDSDAADKLRARKLADVRVQIANINKLQETISRAKESLTLLPPTDETDYSKETSELQVQLDKANASQSALETELRDLGAVEARKQQLAQVQLEGRKVKARQTVSEAICAKLSDIRDSMIETSFGSILDLTNKFTNGILKSPLLYRDGEIGRQEYGSWISWKTFSGTEQAIAFAGLSVALAAAAPIRMVMLDEMGRMNDELKTAVVLRMQALIHKKVITQFIGIDVTDKPYDKIDGVTIIEV